MERGGGEIGNSPKNPYESCRKEESRKAQTEARRRVKGSGEFENRNCGICNPNTVEHHQRRGSGGYTYVVLLMERYERNGERWEKV